MIITASIELDWLTAARVQVLAEALSAAHRKAAALQLECENARRTVASVNERESLRRDVSWLAMD